MAKQYRVVPTTKRPRPENVRSWSEHRKPVAVREKHALDHGTAVCTQCQLIWHDKHWQVQTPKHLPLLKRPDLRATRCPACRQIEIKSYDGEVELRCDTFGRHQQALMALIQHTEAEGRSHNPLHRIATREVEPGGIHLTTIGVYLAERIGKEVQKAFGGTLSLDYLKDENFVRVRWTQP